MRITFEQQTSARVESRTTERHSEVKSSGGTQTAGAFFRQDGGESCIPGTGAVREKGKTLTQLQQEASVTDVAVQQDFRTLLSHTMSEEDYARLEEDGFRFSEMDPEEAVTIVDKIKAELVKSGEYIAGYTDDLSLDTLTAALGSEVLAQAVADSFRAADIPLTQENMGGVKTAWEMASGLTTPTEGGYEYLVDNEMEPEVWDFYLAQNSGAARGRGAAPEDGKAQGRDTAADSTRTRNDLTAVGKDAGQSAADGARAQSDSAAAGKRTGRHRYYAEDIRGYYTERADGSLDELQQEEIDKVLLREGLAVNEENRQAAQQLLAGGLPLTGENVERLERLQSVAFPVTEEVFARAAAAALAEGKEPVHGNLAETDSVYEKAVRVCRYYQEDAEATISVEDITARRQLEEVRLRMTAEVNVRLIRSGFSIDTADMEQLIEALRRAEAEVADCYFPGDTSAVPKYELYRETTEVVRELPGLPARILGPWSAGDRTDSLSSFHAEGKALQEIYEKAQESYEALMTAPRKDLGDSIRKAFANVDDILRDLGMDPAEGNRRAVRILGYNRMEISSENIQRVQEADTQVQSVVQKMTPASTLKMIRDGANPLTMSFPELEEYFEASGAQREDYDSAATSYSRFLYGLEQNHQITQEERDAYIGIYRMLHQIDASDGAAVGALVNTGAELHFSNLLSAVRSGRFKSMDVAVTEEFGTTVELIRRGESISEQVARGFVKQTGQMLTEVSYSEEAERACRQAELEQFRQAADADAETVALLNRGQVPLSADNLLAAQALLDPASNPFREWRDRQDRVRDDGLNRMQEGAEGATEEFENLLEHMDGREEFADSCRELTENLDREVVRESLQEADNSMDVRSLQLVHKQLTVAGRLAAQEDYIFPMYIGRELGKVRLTLDRNGQEKGRIDIAVDLSDGERLESHLQAENGTLTGFFVGNTDGAVMKLQKAADIFIDSLSENTQSDWKIGTLPVMNGSRTAQPHHTMLSGNSTDAAYGETSEGDEAYMEVGNAELYRIARAFLKAVRV